MLEGIFALLEALKKKTCQFIQGLGFVKEPYKTILLIVGVPLSFKDAKGTPTSLANNVMYFTS